MRKNILTIWAFGLMLAVFWTVGMQSCDKEDTPEPPKLEEPTTPDKPGSTVEKDTLDFPVTPENPDPDKIYRPVNKLSQVFKNGYLKKTTLSKWNVRVKDDVAIDTTYYTPSVTEYVTDKDNNLVKVLEDGREKALIEYGYFIDSKGDEYQVKYTKYDWTRAFGDITTHYWCKLNEDQMVVDQYAPQWSNGYFYEYKDGHIVKISKYDVVDGKKVVSDIMTKTYDWDSGNMIEYKYNYTDEFGYPDGTYAPVFFNYPEDAAMIENSGALFALFNAGDFSGIDDNLYMAALAGDPSRYLPSSYQPWFSKYIVKEVKQGAGGLPEIALIGHDSWPFSYAWINRWSFRVEYLWQEWN